jgi:hypothetical protein
MIKQSPYFCLSNSTNALMNAIQHSSFPAQRPLHDLTWRDIYLIIAALMTFNLPVGAALIAQVGIGLYLLLTKEDGKSDMKRLLRGHYLSTDPQVIERLQAYEQGEEAEEADTFSPEERQHWYQLVGSLTRTSPKPRLPLYQWRLDLILLGAAFFYQLTELNRLYPDAVDRLFFRRF